jgi:Zn-dependent protease/predicted transcriptional regulator
MFSHRLRLFSLFGFEVRVDASWLLLAILIAWTLAEMVFPQLVPQQDSAHYWSMAIIATIGLLFSIVFHETAHSVVARRFGIQIRGITLFLFGGVAEMESEPTRPRDEFLMALAGPVASFVLAGAFLLVFRLIERSGGPDSVAGVAWYLGFLNLILAIFNLVPAFPLDGGRMLRAALSAWRGDIVWATRIASRAGDLFGILLIVLGVFEILRGDFIGGMWRFLIGLFLRNAAGSAYQQTVARRTLGGLTVAQLMTPDPITAPPDISITDFIESYVYRHHHRQFPVARDGTLLGIIGTRQAASLERAAWPSTAVAEAMVPYSPEDTIGPEAAALDALTQMARSGRSCLYVLSGGRLIGVLSLRDLTDLLSVKLELSGDSSAAGLPDAISRE